MKFEILEHPLYYMDLLPSNFFFFGGGGEGEGGAFDETCMVQFFSDGVKEVVKEQHKAWHHFIQIISGNLWTIEPNSLKYVC